MTRFHHQARLLAVVALVACGPGDEAISLQPDPAPPGQRLDGPRTLTLITGDRVTVRDHGVTVARGPGRQRIDFVRQTHGAHLSVIPSDALPLLRAGRLDHRLFDITALLEAGVDRRSATPLIVTRPRRPLPGARVHRTLRAIDAVALAAPRDGALWRSLVADPAAVGKVWLDGMRKPTLDVSVPLVGAPAAWNAPGHYDGTGVTVAVLDTGIDVAHPDLADRVIAAHNFTAEDPDWPEDALDHVGHGTHVASTIAGSGAASNGAYRGVAPGAKLLDGKICTEIGCSDSAILAGIDWAVANGAQVVNLSLGGYDTPEIDPLEDAVNRLTAERGVLFVIAAGNEGSGYRTISSPGSAEAALTVGAFDKTDHIADFSSRGPRTDGALKPELVAPGVDITAARSSAAAIGEGSYLTMSGTSMAAPHLAGAAAILRQRHPAWTPAQLKATLVAAAHPVPDLDGFTQGAGRLDIARAIEQSVTASPAGFTCGFQRWPHGDDEPVTAAITYTNRGAAPVTLALGFRGVQPQYASVDAPSITVPAGGETTVTVTCDTRVAGADGFAGGQLVASGAGIQVSTPFALEREIESYDVALTMLDRAGATAESGSTQFLAEGANFRQDITVWESGVVRLPRGRYLAMSWIADPLRADGTTAFTLLYKPFFDVAADQTLALDARRGKPIQITVPQRDAALINADASLVFYPSATTGTSMDIDATSLDDLYIAQLAPGSDPRFTSQIGANFARPSDDGGFTDSPYWYGLAWFQRGTAHDGFTHHVRRDELAVVHARYAARTPGERATITPFLLNFDSAFEAGDVWWHAFEADVALPFERVEYHNVARGLKSDARYFAYTADEHYAGGDLNDPVEYGRGHHALRFNAGVFGPTFERLGRSGDTLITYVSPFARPGILSYGDSSISGRLLRDGVEVAQIDEELGDGAFWQIPVAPERARYRLELAADRSWSDTVSSRTTAAWTFTSEHAESAPDDSVEFAPPPSLAFSPQLDANNAARAGIDFEVPIEIVWDELATPRPETVRRPRVWVSYDDGAHWQRADVTGRAADCWRVQLHHPRRAKFVSLRAETTTTSGDAIELSIIRAYRLR